MAKISTFRDLIQDVFYNQIFDELKSFIEENPRSMSTTYQVRYPDEAELYEFYVKFVDITNSLENEILFDVIVNAEIAIAQTVKRNRETDDIEQWFRISCSAILDDGIRNFTVNNVNLYSENKSGSKQNKLSEYLVPTIYKEQLDDIAEDFLSRYYPEALKEPKSVPPLEIAKRMGLDVKELHLTKNCSVFGQMYFSDCEIQYYDMDTRTYKPAEIRRGTIVVDPIVYFMRNVGSMNNTIIHECVHWDKHRKFFELEKLYNKEASRISCQVQEGIRSAEKRSPLEWMEWHANSLAPRILMPAQQTRRKVEELIAKNKKVLQSNHVADIMESVVFELSEFFDVSKIAAKIRMMDLGYTEAEGVYTYVDDRYISNYSFETKALKNNQTFSIGIQDALYEYATNDDFKVLLDSGNYLYIDAHFCINDSKYISYDDAGFAKLTDYALMHLDECCLIFDITVRKNDEYGAKFYRECVLYRNAVSDTIVETKYSSSTQNEQIKARIVEIEAFTKDIKALATVKRSLPAGFSESLVYLMKYKKMTNEKLAEMSQVNPRTIQRLRNNEDHSTTLSTVVALCIGLQLEPVLSQDLVQKAGFSFKITEEHITYQMLLHSHYKSSIYECNEVLAANGFKLLGTEE